MKSEKKRLSHEEKYKKYTQIEHILNRPEMYIGSIQNEEKLLYIYDPNENKINEKLIKYVPGLYKIFDELIVNVYDQSLRDKNMNMVKIDIDMSTGKIEIYNNGSGIEIVMHKKENMYIPELIFTELLSSSNFNDDNRITGGMNGLGVK